MLTQVPFYHSVIRKTTVAFGSLFNSLYIVNSDKTSGLAQKIIKVPLAYSPKDKYVIKLQQDPEVSKNIEIQLPRMSFEMNDLTYDSSRQLNKINNTRSANGTEFQYVPVPYIISFSLNTYTRTTEDNLQIMEQILPYFTPEIVVSVKMIPELNLTQDIPFTLASVSHSDSYDGDFQESRMIITTYSFTAKVNLYGPINGLTNYPNEGHFGSSGAGSIIKNVYVDINGNTAKYKAVVDPNTAGPNDSYQILENWDEDKFV